MPRITQEEIDKIVHDATLMKGMPEGELFTLLGQNIFRSETRIYASLTDARIRPYKSFKSIGLEFFQKNEDRLYDLLCNRKTKTPKIDFGGDWVAFITALIGDLKNGTIAALIAIIMKYGLHKFCARRPTKRPPLTRRSRK